MHSLRGKTILQLWKLIEKDREEFKELQFNMRMLKHVIERSETEDLKTHAHIKI